MEDLSKITSNVSKVVDEATKEIREAVNSLEPPKIHLLNRRSTLNICAAVAVDTGQTLFGGILREVGVALFLIGGAFGLYRLLNPPPPKASDANTGTRPTNHSTYRGSPKTRP